MSAHYFLLALFALLFPLLTIATEENAPSPSTLLGAWTPIKYLSDPHVKEIAEFAVSEYNKRAQKSLIFMTVFKGESQIESGTSYRLFITVKDSLPYPVNYEAVVLEKPLAKFKKLISFVQYHNEY